jgi:hypothetical protein
MADRFFGTVMFLIGGISMLLGGGLLAFAILGFVTGSDGALRSAEGGTLFLGAGFVVAKHGRQFLKGFASLK